MAINLLGNTATSTGVRAISPSTNVASPKTTLPSSQVMSDEQRAALRNLGARKSAQNTSFSGLTVNSGSIPSGTTFGKQNSATGTVADTSSNLPSLPPPPPAVNNVSLPIQGDSLGTSKGQTPEQMRAALGNPTSGAGSLLPSSTVNPQTPPAPAAAPTQSGLLNMLVGQVQNGSPDVQQALAYQRQLDNNYQQQVADTNSSGIPLQFAQGREQILRSQYADLANKAATGVSNALSSQGQQFGALQSAAGLTAPAMQFGQLTNPQTGTPIGSAGGNNQLNTAVAQAIQLIRNGASQADAIATSGLSNFGLLGQQLFTQAIQQVNNGTYNPTAQQAIAGQNVTQGAQYQAQAQDISNALQTIAPIKSALIPYMADNNLNSEGVPFANQQIGKINAQANPAAYATMQAAMQEARSFAIQLLGSQSGANPTDVTNSVNSFDFTNFTPTQLSTFLNNLETLGQYRLSQAQSASSAGYGGALGAAQGITSNPGAPLQSGGANSLNNQPDIVKAFEGGTLGATSAVLSKLGGVASDAAVGAIAGKAAELFL